MLHIFFKWRYERKQRAGAFKLPKTQHGKQESPKLGSYLSQTSGSSRNFKPYDTPRRRRRLMQVTATVLAAVLLAWVTYESLVALALIGK